MKIPRDIHEAIFAHARGDAPDECCGWLEISDGAIAAMSQEENTAHSPLRFVMTPQTIFERYRQYEDGQQLGVYHSHTRSAPEPSQTDINFAAGWPGVIWLIAGVSTGDDDLRAWWIEDGQVGPEPLELVE